MIRRADDPRNLTIDGAVATPATHETIDGEVGPRLEAAGPEEGVDHGTVYSADGLFTASIPLETLLGAHIAGGRLQIEDSPTKCWLVKDIARIELTVGRQPDTVPAEERPD